MFLSRVVLSMLSVVSLLFSFSAAQNAEQASGGFVDAQSDPRQQTLSDRRAGAAHGRGVGSQSRDAVDPHRADAHAQGVRR